MGAAEFQPDGRTADSARFEDTSWWVVRQAASLRPTEAELARANLCRAYWRPIYAYIRRAGYGHEDAQDLTQEFFARLLEKRALETASAKKGKFRSWLLLWLKRLLADEWDRAHRKKRGGGQTPIALDADDLPPSAHPEPADEQTPDKLFDRAWAESVLTNALNTLRDEFHAAGKNAVFETLRAFVTCEQAEHYAAVAARLGWSENHVKVTVHRLRRRLRDLVRTEIGRTARNPTEAEEEFHDLLAILAAKPGSALLPPRSARGRIGPRANQ